jgi:hypothetical protein
MDVVLGIIVLEELQLFGLSRRDAFGTREVAVRIRS